MPEQTLVSSFGRLLGQLAFDWFQSMYPKIKFRESSSFTIFYSNNNKSDMQMYDDDHPQLMTCHVVLIMLKIIIVLLSNYDNEW